MTRPIDSDRPGALPASLQAQLDRAQRKHDRLMRRRPRTLTGPAGPLAWLAGWAGLQPREAIARRARRRWREILRRRAKARGELQGLQARAGFILAAQAELDALLASNERLAFAATQGAPDISVILAVWNQAPFVLRCLRALRAQTGPSIEVLLVDNASGEETQRLLARLDGVRVLRNATNEGFLRACNQAGAEARGEALLLLNSDAFVREGALASAYAALAASPDIGAVGGRLILPDGALQEAGSIIWADGTTNGYGRGLAPDAPEAMAGRDVDFCSGAFLMIPRALWRRLNGFDEAYAPGYYEEADFCMRLRAAGYRVVFEPKAAVDHFEFGSEAKVGDAARASQRNLATFRYRHAEALRKQPPRPAPP